MKSASLLLVFLCSLSFSQEPDHFEVHLNRSLDITRANKVVAGAGAAFYGLGTGLKISAGRLDAQGVALSREAESIMAAKEYLKRQAIHLDRFVPLTNGLTPKDLAGFFPENQGGYLLNYTVEAKKGSQPTEVTADERASAQNLKVKQWAEQPQTFIPENSPAVKSALVLAYQEEHPRSSGTAEDRIVRSYYGLETVNHRQLIFKSLSREKKLKIMEVQAADLPLDEFGEEINFLRGIDLAQEAQAETLIKGLIVGNQLSEIEMAYHHIQSLGGKISQVDYLPSETYALLTSHKNRMNSLARQKLKESVQVLKENAGTLSAEEKAVYSQFVDQAEPIAEKAKLRLYNGECLVAVGGVMLLVDVFEMATRIRTAARQ